MSPPIPSVARGIELLGEVPGSGYQRAPLLVRRVDGQTIHVTPLLYRVLEAIDGSRDHLEIAWEVAARTDKLLTAEEVAWLIDEKLRPLGLVTADDGTEPVVKRTNPLLALRLRLVVSNPKVTNRVTAPFAPLFHPAVVVPVLLAFAAITGWVLFDKGLGAALHEALYQPRLLLLVFALTALSAGFHEFGHAAACRYGGATPGAMGAALYLVWPAFYTDVSDSYRLGRAGRLRVDLGGLYFNAIFAVATFAAWAITRSDVVLVMVPIQLFQMVRQLLPFVRFDGYHILADLTGVPDLFAHLRPTLRGLLPRHWGKPETRVLKPWARVVVTAWVVVTVPALAACLVMMVLALPRIVATAADSLQLQYAVLQENLDDGALAHVATRLVSLVAIALPPLSIAYLLTRITRRTSLRIWRAAENHPHGRTAATTALATVAAFVVMAWWPGGQYAPVQATERVAAADGFGIRPGPVLPGLSNADPVPVAAGRTDERATGRAAGSRDVAGARPTGGGDVGTRPGATITLAGTRDRSAADRPDRRPQDDDAGAGRAAWPFPFDPPPEPRAGDNFAVAVNTVDGNRVSEMQSSLLWLHDERIDQRNRSYALASCAGCTTVATAFQVIVANGNSRTVIPENAAVAVNYQCTTCVTHSIAVQLVVTTTETPPDNVRRMVESRFRVAEGLERSAQQIPTAELRSRLLALKAEILALLDPYTKDATTSTDTDGDQVAADQETAEAAAIPTTTTTAPAASDATTPDPTTSTTTPASTTTSTTAPASTTTTTGPTATTTTPTTATTTTTPTTAPATTTTTTAAPGDVEPTTTTTTAPG